MDGILRWRPQVFVDHHSTTSSFFFPPVAQAVNMNLPRRRRSGFATYGRGNAAAFDRYGWQYYVGGVFDFSTSATGTNGHVPGRHRDDLRD